MHVQSSFPFFNRIASASSAMAKKAKAGALAMKKPAKDEASKSTHKGSELVAALLKNADTEAPGASASHSAPCPTCSRQRTAPAISWG